MGRQTCVSVKPDQLSVFLLIKLLKWGSKKKFKKRFNFIFKLICELSSFFHIIILLTSRKSFDDCIFRKCNSVQNNPSSLAEQSQRCSHDIISLNMSASTYFSIALHQYFQRQWNEYDELLRTSLTNTSQKSKIIFPGKATPSSHSPQRFLLPRRRAFITALCKLN